ncbi:MAG: RNA polymerase sigma factor [Planctomycetota bacterium]|jgi:RNA polymerase sigma factor (sigma-70 family)
MDDGLVQDGWVERFLAEERELFAYALVLTGHEPDAEDLVQTALLRLVRRGIAPDRPTAYLMRSIRNTWIDQHRRRRDVASLGDTLLEAAAAPDQEARRERVRRALDLLSPDELEVVVLHIDGGLSLRDIAVVLDRPVGTVSSIYARARRRVEKHLRREEAADAGVRR